MNKKTAAKLISVLFVLTLGFLVFLGCGAEHSGTSNPTKETGVVTKPVITTEEAQTIESDMPTELTTNAAEPADHRVLGDSLLEDCRLEIIYDGRENYGRPLTLLKLSTTFAEDSGIYREIVPGEQLQNNPNFVLLLKLLDEVGKENLPPVQSSIDNYQSLRGVSYYYVLRGKDGEKLFDVTLGAENFVDYETKTPTGDAEFHSILVTVHYNGVKLPYHDLFFHGIEAFLTHGYQISGAGSPNYIPEESGSG